MSSPNSYLICLDELHAEFVDELVMERLRDLDGNKDSQWSGVFTDGTRYGILWAAPVSELFGDLVADGETIAEEVVDAEGVSDWQLVVPVTEEAPLP